MQQGFLGVTSVVGADAEAVRCLGPRDLDSSQRIFEERWPLAWVPVTSPKAPSSFRVYIHGIYIYMYVYVSICLFFAPKVTMW